MDDVVSIFFKGVTMFTLLLSFVLSYTHLANAQDQRDPVLETINTRWAEGQKTPISEYLLNGQNKDRGLLHWLEDIESQKLACSQPIKQVELDKFYAEICDNLRVKFWRGGTITNKFGKVIEKIAGSKAAELIYAGHRHDLEKKYRELFTAHLKRQGKSADEILQTPVPNERVRVFGVTTSLENLDAFFGACYDSSGYNVFNKTPANAATRNLNTPSQRASFYNGLRFFRNLYNKDPKAADTNLFQCRNGKIVKSSTQLRFEDYFDASMDDSINCSGNACKISDEDCSCLQRQLFDISKIPPSDVKSLIDEKSCNNNYMNFKGQCDRGYVRKSQSTQNSGPQRSGSKPTSGRK